MTPIREFVRGGAVLALVVGAPNQLLAQARSQAGAQAGVTAAPGLYAPKSAPQSPPLRVEVLDGSRFRDIETQDVYRLYGVETCAPGQTARLGRQSWPCGTVAAAWLVAATLNKWVACNVIRQENGEHLARCASADHADIAADMVRDGVAVTIPPTTRDSGVRAYAAAEQAARKVYRGLWASSFEMPWKFRARLSAQAAEASKGKAAP
jgi:endonuclease YncB( thermonuclease family)